MSGRNSQSIGVVSEQAALQGLVEVLGYFEIPYTGDDMETNFKETLNEEGVNRQDIIFAQLAGNNLGKTIGNDISTDLYNKGKRLADFTFKFRNTGGEGVQELKTDDIVVELTSDSETIVYPFSLKTKSKTGTKVVGSSSSNNLKFTERLFKNTPLLELYPEILDLVDDTTYRNIWKKAKKELKLSPDAASKEVDATVGYKWKVSAQDRLQKGIEYAFSKPEYTEYKSTIAANLLSLSGFKLDTHLALALRKKDQPSTTYYSSLSCRKYNSIVEGNYKNIVIERLSTGGMKIFLEKSKSNRLEICIDYIPNGIIPFWNPSKTLL
jgi:hypothetical protein